MIVRYKTQGTYLDYTLDGTLLSLGGGALAVNLSDLQEDWPVSLDVCSDGSGRLVLGPARRYAAQIDLPARGYTIIKGKADDFGFPQLWKNAVPLDPEQVVLTLWALEAK